MKPLLPRLPGTYILCLHLKKTLHQQIGRLGQFYFKKGFYFYVGSAFGPGGLNARCGHHLRISDRPRWHVDYLRQHCHLTSIIYSTDIIHLEHQWANQLAMMSQISTPISGFGASDCQCHAHLFFCTDNKIDVVLNTIKSNSRYLSITEPN